MLSFAGGGVVRVLPGELLLGAALVVVVCEAVVVAAGLVDVGVLGDVVAAVVDDAVVGDPVVDDAAVDEGEVLVEVGLGVPESDPPPHAANPPVRAAATRATAQRCSFIGEP